MILNFSLDGLGVTLPTPLRPGSILEIAADSTPNAPAVRVRIVHIRPLADLWLCGCELESPIRSREVRAWLAGANA